MRHSFVYSLCFLLCCLALMSPTPAHAQGVQGVNSVGATLPIGAGGTQSLFVTSTGNIGVGTSAPAATLDVQGTDTGYGLAAFNRNDLPSSNFSHILFGGTGDWYIRSSTGAGKIIIQDTGGNVGIGTTNPGQGLTVINSGQAAFLGSNSRGLFMQDDGTEALLQGTNSAVSALAPLKIASGSYIYLPTTGNIGIGTATPQAMLDVNGGIQSTLPVNLPTGYTVGAACSTEGMIAYSLSSHKQIFCNGYVARCCHCGSNNFPFI